MHDDGETDSAGHEVQLRDEVLELLYWMEGERLASRVTPEAMMRFIAFPESEVRAVLELLAARGDVAVTDGNLFCLTESGRREAARRFADDFADLLHQGHGECNDPTCDCHTNPDGAAACHTRTEHSGHQH